MSGRSWHWPCLIVALLTAGAGANVALVVIAVRDTSFAVEHDYYDEAVRWDAAMAQEAENARLGWSVALRLEPLGGGRSRVIATVTDAAGHRIDDARVTLETFHSARARDVIAGSLGPHTEGSYAATLPLDRAGLWEFRLRIERRGQVFTQTVTQLLARTL